MLLLFVGAGMVVECGVSGIDVVADAVFEVVIVVIVLKSVLLVIVHVGVVAVDREKWP